MEVPYQREVVEEEEEEEEELSDVDYLQTRRKPKPHNQKNTNYNNSSSSSFSSSEFNTSITSELSGDSSISFEDYTQSMNTNTYTTNNNNNSNSNNNDNSNITIKKNGENPKIKIEGGRSEAVEALSQADEEAGFQETKLRDDYNINVPLNQDSNGFTAHQNGSSVVEHSIPESNEGDKEADIGSNATKIPENGVGLNDVESLLDDSANNINVTLTETYNIGNIVNKTVIVRGQNEIVETSPSQGNEPVSVYEVEKVVREQTTHDFFCPNCKSCITDRVILKRRKRKVPEISTDEEIKPDQPVLDVIAPEDVGNDDANDPGAGFGAISCFSCFSIFVPKGDGFLWWRFKPKSEVPLQTDGSTPVEPNDPETSPVDVGPEKSFPLWILTCCQPNHIEKPDNAVPNTPPATTPGHDVGSGVPHLEKPPVASEGGFPLWFMTCCQPSIDRNNLKPTEKPDDTVPPHDLKPQPTKENDDAVPSDDLKPQPTPEYGVPPLVTVHDSAPSDSHLDGDPSSIPEPWTPLPKPSPVTKPVTKPDADFPISTEPKPPTTSTEGADHVLVSITVGPRSPEPPRTQPDLSVSASAISEPLLLSERRRVSGLDIIKAIVYGGLVECITSLSVISSAAGGDATTLNIVALGLANVFGGLIVLLHNIRVLHHEHTVDRYIDQLGRPDHYVLHSIVAVLSYLTFGLLPPVIYGFTFRKSDNKNYKLAILAAVSLVCITFLSIGKAHVRRPPRKYKRTIIYFISIGLMVSGVGYVAGNLINMLLIKLGVFDSSAPPVAMTGLETGAIRGAWSSY